MDDIDISGLDPAAVLAALYNNTRAVGTGLLHDIGDMTEEVAAAYLTRCRNVQPEGEIWLDYVYGRPLKVGFTPGVKLTRPDLYDRDAPGGKGACARVIEALRK